MSLPFRGGWGGGQSRKLAVLQVGTLYRALDVYSSFADFAILRSEAEINAGSGDVFGEAERRCGVRKQAIHKY